jgi:hypothetical protein
MTCASPVEYKLINRILKATSYENLKLIAKDYCFTQQWHMKLFTIANSSQVTSPDSSQRHHLQETVGTCGEAFGSEACLCTILFQMHQHWISLGFLGNIDSVCSKLDQSGLSKALRNGRFLFWNS